jgi:hypothetical protein
MGVRNTERFEPPRLNLSDQLRKLGIVVYDRDCGKLNRHRSFSFL